MNILQEYFARATANLEKLFRPVQSFALNQLARVRRFATFAKRNGGYRTIFVHPTTTDKYTREQRHIACGVPFSRRARTRALPLTFSQTRSKPR